MEFEGRGPDACVYRFGEYELDPASGRLLRGGTDLKLRPKAFEFLQRLIEGRYLAAHISGAQMHELPGADHLIYSGDQAEVLDAARAFLLAHR